jgi:FkbM family methyltransferase
MNYGFFWTETSLKRNLLTAKYEPLQPLLLLNFTEELNSEYFFDIGANIGFYSILTSHNKRVKKIYSFEASPNTCAELVSNIQLNKLNNLIEAKAVAVSDSCGEVNFQIESDFSGINSIKETSFHRSDLFSKVARVKSITIDSFFDLSNANLAFKIDVEGHELNVIRGASKLLLNNNCILQIEIYQNSTVEVEKLMGKLGYHKIFCIKNDFYYSNSPALSQAVVLKILEKTLGKFTDVCLGKWPPKNDSPLKLTASYLEGKIYAKCAVDTNRFGENLEYAFYLIIEGKKVETIWYTHNSEVCFDIPNELINKKLFEVRGFVRDKNNVGKKIMQVVRIKLKVP